MGLHEALVYRVYEDAGMQQHGHCIYPTLADTVQEAHALLDFLPPKARAALSGCNRQLRAYFHHVTKCIVMPRRSYVGVVKSSNWPQLEMVVLQTARHPKGLFDGQFAPIATLNLPDQKHSITLLLLKPQQPCKQLPPPFQQLTTALLYLQQYASVSGIVLYNSGLDMHRIAALVIPNWKKLFSLRLHGVQLDAAAASLLASGVWPELGTLDLSMCGLDTAAMAVLVQGQWPELDQLDLSDNPLLDGAAVSMLASANWPQLSDVLLNNSQLGSGSFGWMVQRHWVHLQSLELRQTSMDAAVLSEMAHAHMNHIISLDLASNALGSDAMAALVMASLPGLLSLYLHENLLDAAAAQWLSKGDWSQLSSLVLDDNVLDNEALQHLAEGKWEHLEWLSICDNIFDSDGLEKLTTSDWSEFECIHLDIGLANTATWRVLGLDLQHLPDVHAKIRHQGYVSVYRPEQAVYNFWQGLPRFPVEFRFYDCPTSDVASE